MTAISSRAPIDPSLDLFAEIDRLKRAQKAVILAHYYQDPDIQDLADHLGDSLDLARTAKGVRDSEVILFCGVHFMAETAKILNPEKIVIVPDLDAGCSLADSCPADQLRAFKRKHPDHFVLSYINCNAETKAESDLICTSGNAAEMLRSVPRDRRILFAPDRNLGAWLSQELDRPMDLWPGDCQVHITFSERKIIELKARHPRARFIAHPECEAQVLRHADFVGSTRKMIRYVTESEDQTLIIGTESGILHCMRKASPNKELIQAPVEDKGSCTACSECPHMKLNTVEKIYLALRDLEPRIEMGEDLRRRAERPLQRMLDLSG